MLMICAARPLPPHMPSTSIHGLPRFLALSRNPSIPMTSPLLGLNVSYPHPPPSPLFHVAHGLDCIPIALPIRYLPLQCASAHPLRVLFLCSIYVRPEQPAALHCLPFGPHPLLARAPSVPPCKYARLTQTCAARVAVGADVSLPSLLRALRNPHSTFAFVPSFCAPT